jgi:hypothetical protein
MMQPLPVPNMFSFLAHVFPVINAEPTQLHNKTPLEGERLPALQKIHPIPVSSCFVQTAVRYDRIFHDSGILVIHKSGREG